jgi:FixJ family two-component response regulator
MKQNFTVRQGALDGVEAFLSVAQHRSFRRASAELGVTPSAISQAVRALEARVGATLLDLLSELRRRNIDLPAILITTHPNPAVRDRAALAGVPLIEKPLLNDTLFQDIRAALGRYAPRR